MTKGRRKTRRPRRPQLLIFILQCLAYLTAYVSWKKGINQIRKDVSHTETKEMTRRRVTSAGGGEGREGSRYIARIRCYLQLNGNYREMRCDKLKST